MTATIIDPKEARGIVPELTDTRNPDVWVYRFTDRGHGWTLSVATHAEPGSKKLSLGGFRIAPESRTQSPGFTPDREAIALAIGMEEKIHWSRVIKVGGPLAMKDITRTVGGKCVLVPSAGARIGEPDDAALLDFAIESLHKLEASADIHVITGQDLGHGLMFDRKTKSLEYLNARFRGSVMADTSKPTGEGNYRLLLGMLRAVSVDPAAATVGLLGCGNIGMHLFGRLREHFPSAEILVLEAREDRRSELEALGVRTWAAEYKREFLAQPMDALAVNAAGGSLDREAVDLCVANSRLGVVCGCENLVMPDHHLEADLRGAHKIFAPTELGGMMGYLTAVEEYLSVLSGVPFDVNVLYEAAGRLEEAGYETTSRIIAGGYAESFESGVTGIFGEG